MKLNLSSSLSLPLDAATESFAILGRRGSGKTHTAVVMAEEMLTAGVQVVVIDPLDVWWGLRVSKDGKTAGFPIYVAGGSHADIPLSADAGKVLADAVVDQGLSIVLSTRHLSKSDQRRFVGDFCERLYDRKADPQHRTALHVDIDEADAFVPQRLMPGAERCFGAVDTLVRRGRSSGLAVTLISQRPQVINKDVLSQTEVLVSHQLTGPQDRKALQAWIEANDDENRSAEFMGALASLPKGRAWFWSPGLLKIFKPVDVRDRTTFDSSATPKPGVVGVKPRAFAEVDLKKLNAEIAATIEKAKADDPRELRKQIAEKDKQLKALHGGVANPTYNISGKTTPVLTDADRALLAKLADGLKNIPEFIAGTRASLLADAERLVTRALSTLIEQSQADADSMRRSFEQRLDAKGFQKILGKLATVETPANYSHTIPAVRNSLIPRAPAVATSRPASLPPSRAHEGSLPPGEHATLTAALQYPDGLDRKRLGILTGYKRSSRDAYIARLTQKGLVTTSGACLYPTEAGRASMNGSFEPLPTGAALIEYWRAKLPEGERASLEVLIAAHGADVERERIDDVTGYKRSSRDAYLTRLKARGLVEFSGRGMVRASSELFS